MNSFRNAACVVALSIASVVPMQAAVSQATQAEIASTEDALRRAESAGAPLYARALYDEASTRLTASRAYFNGDKGGSNGDRAHRQLTEAYHAARAAEAVARVISEMRETESLRQDIARLGGTLNAPPVNPALDETVVRGDKTDERIRYAKMIYERAAAAGAKEAAVADMKNAKVNLDLAMSRKDTAEKTDASHFAYIAEMLARRAEATALRTRVSAPITGLRMERTRLAQAASEANAAREKAARLEAERSAAALRAQLDAESANRQAQQDELNRLRAQIAENETRVREQMTTDREARIRAEAQLDESRRQYQAALAGSSDPIAIEQLRRQVEDQSIALRSMQNREQVSEQAYSAEIERLRAQLDTERSKGGANAQAVADREAQIAKQQAELAQMRADREAAERNRAAAEQQQLATIQAAEERRRQAENEATELRQEVAQERARAEAVTSELNQTKEKMRLDEMQRALSAVAKTRTDSRGLIVTLPGIFFDTGKSALKPGAKATLNRIAMQLAKGDNVSVAVEGHTDNVGSEESNTALSQKRADAVRDYLVMKGMPAERITASGKGESTPVATNATAAGRQQNRRVELVITQ